MITLARALRKFARRKKIAVPRRFFKTGKGEYGAGDLFLGITIPSIRAAIKDRWNTISIKQVRQLLRSKYHEERSAALLILVEKFQRGNTEDRRKIYQFYLENIRYINNWDLVDLSADKIVGGYLDNAGNKTILKKLASSQNLWERRIAVLATFHFIKQGDFKDFFQIAKMLLKDRQDLIHKALGWMLREVGKRSLSSAEKFIDLYSRNMPRTMLRYAIERFPEKKRKKFMKR